MEKEIITTTEKTLQSLQQGSDVRGIAMEGIPDESITLTPIAIYFISVGYAQWLSRTTSKPPTDLKVSIGRDPRLSGDLVRSSVSLGLITEGVQVMNFGLASTPAMFMSCIMEEYRFDGAMMLTASHLPFNRNGIKFFNQQGGLDKPDVKEILKLAAEACIEANIDLGHSHLTQCHRSHSLDVGNANQATSFLLEKGMAASNHLRSDFDFMPVYAQHLQSIIKSSINSKGDYDHPLKGFKIAVDAGNGSGGFVATKVLEPLGADISGSQFLDPDGYFPNHIPNPEDEGAAAAGIDAVMKSGSDLGILYDTDVDRSGVVDKSGISINSNRMIALMSAIVLREHPGTTIVTDSVTSNGLRDFIEAQGGRHYRYKRGYKNVIGKGMELNHNDVSCELMMETSGHGALKENYFMDDGAYMSLKIIIEMVQRKQQGQGSIGNLINTLKEPLEGQEFRIRIQSPNFKEIAAETTEKFRKFVENGSVSRWRMEKENYEGWRVIVDEGNGLKGWCLLRPSIHDPLCVLNIESEIPGGLNQTAKEILKFFDVECKHFPLDLTPLQSLF